MANESIKLLKSILDVTIRIDKRQERDEKKKDKITSGMVGGTATPKTKVEELGDLGKYINSIASGLKKFSKIDEKTTDGFLSFIKKFYKSADLINEEHDLSINFSDQMYKIVNTMEYVNTREDDINNAIFILGRMRDSFMGLAKGLAFMIPVFIIALPVIPFIIALLVTMGAAFSFLGLFAPIILLGAWAVNAMGNSLWTLAKGLALTLIVLLIIGPLLPTVALLGDLILTLGLMFMEIAIYAPFIIIGAWAVRAMGWSMKFLAWGLVYVALAMVLVFKIMGPTDFTEIAKIIFTLGVVYAALGVLSKFILKGTKSIKRIGTGLIMLGIGLVAFVTALSIAGSILMVAPKEALAMSAAALIGLIGFYTLMGLAHDKIVLGTKAMTKMGISLLIFSGGLLAFALALLIIGPKHFITIVLAIGIMGLLFSMFGHLKKVRKGAINVMLIGVSFAALAIGLLLLAPVFILFLPVALLFTFFMSAIGTIYATLGEFNKNVIKGALVAMLIGASLLVISIGLLPLAISLLFVDWGDLFMLPLFIATMALVYGIMGIVPIPAAIALGALAAMMIGLSLIPLAIGLTFISVALLFVGFDTMTELVGVILALSLTYALVGMGSILILAGALAIYTIAESLALLGPALIGIIEPLKKTGFSTLVDLGVTIGVLAFEFAAIGAASFLISAGAESVKTIGIGLQELAKGIEVIATVDLSGFDTGKLEELITGLASSFKALGEGGASSTSYFKIISGADFGKTPIERGIAAAAQIGPALSSIAIGISAFANLEKIPRLVGYDKRGNPIYNYNDTVNLTMAIENIEKVFGVGENSEFSILQPFIDFSNHASDDSGWSLWRVISGNDLGRTSLQRGIASAGSIGQALTAIAKGISVFANLKEIPKITGYDNWGNPIFDYSKTFSITDAIDNMKLVFGVDGEFSILDPFIKFSKAASDDSGWSLWRVVSGNDLGKTSLQRGIASVAMIGQAMSAVGQGISVFADLSAVPKIIGYNKDGSPIYGKESVDVKNSLSLFDTALTSLNKTLEKQGKDENIKNYRTFIDTFTELTNEYKDFDKFATSFERLATSVGKFADNINKIDPKLFTTFTDWSKYMIDNKTSDLEIATASAIDYGVNVVKNIWEDPPEPSKEENPTEVLYTEMRKMRVELAQLKQVMVNGLDVNVTNYSLKMEEI